MGITEDEVSNEIETTSEVENQESSAEQVTEGAEVPPTEIEGENKPEGDAPTEIEGEESDESDDDGTYKPNVKFSVNEKEMEIPKEFHSLMKDADSEKMVRELFEKANGLEPVKTKLTETRAERDGLRVENKNLHSSIGKARGVYASAVQSGNLHKLDGFFKLLDIPQQVVMNYAIEKAKLDELKQTNPEQARLFEENLYNETLRDKQQEDAVSLRDQNHAKDVELRSLQLETALASPQISSLATELESKFGVKGLFREEIIAAGQQAWQADETVLTPIQAIQKVIAKYGLGKQTTATPAAQTPGKPAMVQRTTQTIPNVSSKNTASPVAQKKGPRSIEDIKKLSARASAGEQV